MICKLTFLFICVYIPTIHTNNYYIVENGQDHTTQDYTTKTRKIDDAGGNDRVMVQLYYESLCPDCRSFDTMQFKETVLELAPYLDIHLYPYGNAQTKVVNGQYEFICQHGPPECYGNKLHACAIDQLKNMTAAVVYNACLMSYLQSGKGSDDAAADACGMSLNVDSQSIKQCAKGYRGIELLKFYGDESKKAAFNSVPHVLINGVPQGTDNFKENVCKAFKNPPPQCY